MIYIDIFLEEAKHSLLLLFYYVVIFTFSQKFGRVAVGSFVDL